MRRAWGSSTSPPPSVPGGAIERDHEAVALRGDQRPLTAQLPAALVPGATIRAGSRAVMDLRARGLGAAEVERRVDDPGRAQVGALTRDDVAAAHVVDPYAHEVDRDALPGVRALHGGVVHLDATDPHAFVGRQEAQAVARADRARPERAGHDRSPPRAP